MFKQSTNDNKTQTMTLVVFLLPSGSRLLPSSIGLTLSWRENNKIIIFL